MLSDLGYDNPHPFGAGNVVLVDSKYYEENKVSHGDLRQRTDCIADGFHTREVVYKNVKK